MASCTAVLLPQSFLPPCRVRPPQRLGPGAFLFALGRVRAAGIRRSGPRSGRWPASPWLPPPEPPWQVPFSSSPSPSHLGPPRPGPPRRLGGAIGIVVKHRRGSCCVRRSGRRSSGRCRWRRMSRRSGRRRRGVNRWCGCQRSRAGAGCRAWGPGLVRARRLETPPASSIA